jgi:uncharacterized protein (UPF0212 family)
MKPASKELISKHIPAATHTHTKIEEHVSTQRISKYTIGIFLETVPFSVVQIGCEEGLS